MPRFQTNRRLATAFAGLSLAASTVTHAAPEDVAVKVLVF